VPVADRIACTHVSGRYNFTKKDFLNEGADAILATGMRVIKLYLHNPANHYKFNSNWPEFRSLTQMARDPHYRAVFAKPFSTYIMTAFSVGVPNSPEHYSDERYAEDVRQFEELTAYLLRAYKGKGKTFILQNWEGDWAVGWKPDLKEEPSEKAIQGMTRWMNARQEGVDRARAAFPNTDVKVYHACEVNLVAQAIKGRRTVTNDVLPRTHCDLYSYSAYDTIGIAGDDFAKGQAAFRAALEHMASKAPPSKAFGHNNVYVGEFGWPEVASKQDPSASTAKSLNVIRMTVETALDFGCPYIVYWQLYDNEARSKERPTNSDVRGFYLIKPDGTHAAAYDYFASLLKPERR
jgi:hypothetical protein